MLKKVTTLVLAMLMLLSVAGCKKDAETASSDDSAGNANEFMQFESNGEDENTSGGSTGGGSTGGGSTSTGGGKGSQGSTGSGGGNTATTKKYTSALANKDYKGKSFTFLYWYEPNGDVAAKIKAFNKAHNAKVKMKIDSDPSVSLAKSIASGQPYDIVANMQIYFPQTIFTNIYEPLKSYLSEEDYYNSKKPDDGGINAGMTESAFGWDGEYYALASAKSTYVYMFYYNKKLFKEAGLEDPWELYQKGQWTWDKVAEYGRKVYDPNSGVSLLADIGFGAFSGICGSTDAIVYKNGKYTENVTNSKYVKCVELYKEMVTGKNAWIIKGTSDTSFPTGQVYMTRNTTDSYDYYLNKVKVSSAFDRKAENLGVVPVPTHSLNTENKYPGNVPQGYSSTKGAKDPSVAACYALFESRYEYTNYSKNQIPADMLNTVYNLYAKNPGYSFAGFKDSSGKNVNEVLDSYLTQIMDGADVASTLESARQPVQRCLDYATTLAKDFKK